MTLLSTKIHPLPLFLAVGNEDIQRVKGRKQRQEGRVEVQLNAMESSGSQPCSFMQLSAE